MSALKQLKRSLTVNFIRSMALFVNLIPRRIGLFIFSWLGLLAWWLDIKDRHRIRRHLSLVYKDGLSTSEKDKIGRAFFVNTAKNLVDLVRMRRYYKSEIANLIEVEGLEHFDRAYKKGNGLFGISAHIGNFEMTGAFLAAQGYSIGVIGRRMYDDRMDELLVDNREALGLKNFYTTDSPRKIMRWLADGKAVGVLMDTDSMRVRSMLVPSFNRLSYTPVGHIQLAFRTKAELVPSFCIRTENNRFKVLFKPPIEYDPGSGSEADIARVAGQCNRVIDQFILEHPDQWIWLHNRWHTSPEAAANY